MALGRGIALSGNGMRDGASTARCSVKAGKMRCHARGKGSKGSREEGMLHARLREIRKAKGLTLQQVAERVKPSGTTPQTIGRLETGARTLTLEWVRRIADAMEVDPAELLSLPGAGDVEITGTLGRHGRVQGAGRDRRTLALRTLARDSLAVKVAEAAGQYRVGDVIVCRRLGRDDWSRAEGADALVEDADGYRYFGKLLAGSRAGRVDLAPLEPHGAVRRDLEARIVAPVIALLRIFEQ